jgi:hypothetical protein
VFQVFALDVEGKYKIIFVYLFKVKSQYFVNKGRVSKVVFTVKYYVFSEFPIGNTAITVGLMEGPKPGTMLLFRFEVPRDQKQ